MTTADELLTTNDVLWIDVNTRQIEIPPSVKLLGVASDDEVQKLKFAMSRRYNDIDLSEYTFYVNYENAKGGKNSYLVQDVVVETDTITFSWMVNRIAVEYPGTVKFIVCLKRLVSGAVIDSEFNTTIASLPVLEGIETTGAYEDDEKRDELAAAAYLAIEQALETDLRGEPGHTPIKGVDYFTDVEKEEFTEEVIQSHNAMVANAFTGSLRGEVVRADDVNPVEHSVKAKIQGKNLFKPEVKENVLGVDYTYTWQCTADVAEDGKITITSTVAKDSGVAYLRAGSVEFKKGRTYIYTLYEAENVGMRFWWKHLTTTSIGWSAGVPFTPSEDMILDFAIYMEDISEVGKTASVYVQLEEGDTATEYEPYVDPSTVTVVASGKNLVEITGKTETVDGVTFTVNGNGSITVNGTAEVNVFYKVGKITLVGASSYHLSGAPSTSSISTYMLYLHDNKSYVDIYDVGAGKTFTPTNGTCDVVIAVYKGQTVNNIKFYPMVEAGSEKTDFKKFEYKTMYTPSADGICDIISVSPTMTIFTDTLGITVECEYGRDSNKVLDGIGGGSPVDAIFDNVLLRDQADGKTYSIYVSNGSLKMEVVE